MDIAKVLRSQLALVDADTVQLDEASIVGYPQDAPWAADAINCVLDGILNEKAVHLCFRNYGGQPMLRGFWRDMVPFLNRLRTDHLVLKFARRGYDELEVLNDLDRRIELGIGVVDIKDNEVESPDSSRRTGRKPRATPAPLETVRRTIRSAGARTAHAPTRVDRRKPRENACRRVRRDARVLRSVSGRVTCVC
jgi:methionine synthase II (cobalamin-independent)